MLRRLTSGWTDLHVPLTGSCLTVGMLGWTAAGTSGTAGPVLLVVVTLTALVALGLDAMTGLAVGLLGAAASVAAILLLGGANGFATQSAHAVLVLVLGVLSGTVGDRVRHGRRLAARVAAGAVAPVPGSLGLLSLDDAHSRLEEEITRARLHLRPLSTALVQVVVHDTDLSDDDVRRARRAVARVLESELRATDVPFVSPCGGEFGVIMPETDAASAADVLESVLILARDATFAARGAGARRHVGEVAVVQVGTADVGDAEECPRAFLAASRDDMVVLPAWSEA